MDSNAKNKLNSVLKFLREAFIVDFSKPLSIKNQFMVMFVTLFISTILFGVVCIVNNSLISVTGVALTSNDTNGGQSVSATGTVEPQESSKPKRVINSTELLKQMTTIEKSYDEIHNGDLILVNKDYDCRHDGENVVSLLDVKTGTYIVADASVSVDKSIVDNVNNMFDDFYDIYGESEIMIACGYRSSTLQSELYDAEAARKGDDEAAQWVAPPGYSEHQTGFVFDLDLLVQEGSSGIDYDGQGIYSWINENCYQYGFILRYIEGKEKVTGYEYEPWHFRYVGVPAATYIMSHQITLEEYMKTIQNYSAEKPLIIEGEDDKIWCTYYVKADEESDTDIPVPQNYPYVVSGDNFSGFIVTVAIDDDSFTDESSQESEEEGNQESQTYEVYETYEPVETYEEPVYYEEPTEDEYEGTDDDGYDTDDDDYDEE